MIFMVTIAKKTTDYMVCQKQLFFLLKSFVKYSLPPKNETHTFTPLCKYAIDYISDFQWILQIESQPQPS